MICIYNNSFLSNFTNLHYITLLNEIAYNIVPTELIPLKLFYSLYRSLVNPKNVAADYS